MVHIVYFILPKIQQKADSGKNKTLNFKFQIINKWNDHSFYLYIYRSSKLKLELHEYSNWEMSGLWGSLAFILTKE